VGLLADHRLQPVHLVPGRRAGVGLRALDDDVAGDVVLSVRPRSSEAARCDA
jgi:hypothetical protein